MTACEERAVLIGAQPGMVGIETRPHGEHGGERAAVAAILLGAGLVHRVGPNRLTVRLARRLAARGVASVRFDHRGIGDSAPRPDGKPFEACAVEEAREVMDHLAQTENVHAFVLLGICSGAETALGTAAADPRVVGICMINGGGQGAGAAWDTYEYARVQVRHYLTNALLSADAWRRALTGRIQYRRLVAALGLRLRNLFAKPEEVTTAASETAANIERLTARGLNILWVHSEKDFSRDYFATMFPNGLEHLLGSGRVRHEVLPFVDHTMTPRHGQERFLDLIERWVADLARTQPAPGATNRAVAL